MCGISLVLHANESSSDTACVASDVDDLKTSIREQLSFRGPDVSNEVSVDIQHASGSSTAWLCGSVLHIQGENAAVQPYVDHEGNVLLWNGEVFGYNYLALDGWQEVPGESDTITVSRYLRTVIARGTGADVSALIATALAKIYGPYAFIYYYKASDAFYFGRDPFGRRSLVMLVGEPSPEGQKQEGEEGQDKEEEQETVDLTSPSPLTVFALSSVAPARTCTTTGRWEEVGIGGIYALLPHSAEGGLQPRLTPWPQQRLRLGRTSPPSADSVVSTAAVEGGAVPAGCFRSVLQEAVDRRVQAMPGQSRSTAAVSADSVEDTVHDGTDADTTSNPAASKVGVLFSGGIDSVLLTALLHHSLDPRLAVDLLNVTFLKDSPTTAAVEAVEEGSGVSKREHGCTVRIPANPTPSPDRLAAIAAHLELQALFPERQWRLVHIDVGEEERYAHEQRIRDLIRPANTHMDLNIGTAFWFASRGEGYLRSYSAAELQRLLGSALQPSAEEEEQEEGAGQPRGRQRGLVTKERPMLRHGGAGAAAGVGRSTASLLSAPAPSQPHPAGTGKAQCAVEGCLRVYKQGCPSLFCKKCCDGAHRKTVLAEHGADIAHKVELLCNPCPAHRTKDKHLSKMLGSLTAQLRCLPSMTAGTVDAGQGAPEEEICSTGDSTSLPVTEHSTVAAAVDSTSEGVAIPTTTEEVVYGSVYRSRCKALLVGIGADEQMAGYGRHRTVFLRALAEATSSCDDPAGPTRVAATALEAELNKDLARLWKRNLGRDDRCVGDNGREAWFPFLDEAVVQLLQSLSILEIADLQLPQGVGDKRILREAARQLGLGRCTELVKRAIQFGTRVAQHTNQHYHGSNRRGKGDTQLPDA